jgi:hypothetical protein
MNAKQEFIEHVGERKVLCAQVDVHITISRTCFLVQGDDLQEFLEVLNFAYDADYGKQKLFGTIWYEDGTYSRREEYDGAEWWEHVEVPKIPDYLRGPQVC